MRAPKPTPAQVDAIAGALSSFRPGQPRWSKRAIADQLHEALEHGLAGDALALVVGGSVYAFTAHHATPDMLGARGPHWDFTGLTTSTGAPIVNDPRCHRCDGIHGPEGPLDAPGSLCRPVGHQADVDTHIADARRQLASAKEGVQ